MTKKQVKKPIENTSKSMNRRTFIGGVTSASVGLSIVPAYVLGGNRHTAPSDKINVAYIGVGTQGLRELPELLEHKDVQVTAVCDPQKKAINYFDWGPEYLRNNLRKAIGNPNWETGGNNSIPGGRDNGQQIIEAYYAKQKGSENYKGCAAYSDFRELFAKESDIDAVKVMSTDHSHGVIAMAALNRGIPITMHKPIANRLIEGHKVIEKAKNTDVVTHLIPWESNGSMDQIMAWIDGGVIGELKEVHNWSRRPVWPHYAKKPSDKVALPEGFDWDVWLGPEAERAYHPHYTNMVFRGWYDFGGGSMADMGHYSLWTVFEALGLEKPTIIEPNFSHVCDIKDNLTAYTIQNDYSFPFASTVRFKYPSNGKRSAVDLVWYDGGMKPPVPQEFYDKDMDFPDEGMLFVGDKGSIMTSEFRVRKAKVLSGDFKRAKELKIKDDFIEHSGINRFIEGVKTGKQIDGSFRQAWPITEAVNLYAAALRSGKILRYDGNAMKITNDSNANSYLDRSYRKGWNLEDM